MTTIFAFRLHERCYLISDTQQTYSQIISKKFTKIEKIEKVFNKIVPHKKSLFGFAGQVNHINIIKTIKFSKNPIKRLIWSLALKYTRKIDWDVRGLELTPDGKIYEWAYRPGKFAKIKYHKLGRKELDVLPHAHFIAIGSGQSYVAPGVGKALDIRQTDDGNFNIIDDVLFFKDIMSFVSQNDEFSNNDVIVGTFNEENKKPYIHSRMIFNEEYIKREREGLNVYH